MKINYISKAAILFLLFPICLSLFAEEIPMNQPSGSFGIQGSAYQPGMDMAWMINTGTNKPVLFTYSIDLETFDYRDYVAICNVDDFGNITSVAHFIGLQSGSVSTTIPNGKAKVVFYSYIDGYADPSFFTGFTMSFSVDNSMTLTENIYVSGKVGIGSTAPQEKLHINGNVYVAGNIKGNIGLAGALRVKTSGGYIDIGPQSSNTANFDTDRANFSFNKGIYSATGEFCSPAWTDINLKTYTVGDRTIPSQVFSRMTILNSNGNVGIGTTTPTAKLDVVGDVQIDGNKRLGCYLADLFTHDNKNIGHYSLGWFNDSWNPGANSLWMSSFGGMKFFAGGQPRLSINSNGYVGIGLTNPDKMLTVNGAIHAKEIIVDVKSPLADYVFYPDYELMPLHKVEQFVKTNRHLPEIPSAAEVKENGLNMGEMQNKLLQKIEELTLYMIELQKQIEQQNEEIAKLKAIK